MWRVGGIGDTRCNISVMVWAVVSLKLSPELDKKHTSCQGVCLFALKIEIYHHARHIKRHKKLATLCIVPASLHIDFIQRNLLCGQVALFLRV